MNNTNIYNNFSNLEKQNIRNEGKIPHWINLNSSLVKNYNLIIGWDTEYQNDSIDKYHNLVISYQFSAIYIPKNKYSEGIIYIQNNQKLTLEQLIKKIVTNLELSWSEAKNLNICLISHFSLAEWSSLEERNNLNDYLIPVRKTLASFNPFTLKIKWENKHLIRVNIQWRDTYLLAPDDNKSLDNLSTSTYNKKVELADKYDKGNIQQLLNENPILFKKYALTDARVALEYYLNFMSSYQSLTGIDEEPLTVGDGSVRYYRKELANRSEELYGKKYKRKTEELILGVERKVIIKNGKFKYETSLKDKRFRTEGSAKLSYLGSINTAYVIGKQNNPNKWYLDIDFTNAFPSGMATLPIIDWDKPVRNTFSWKEIQEIEEKEREKQHCRIAFFEVNFKYHNEIFQPALPVNTIGGIIYPLEGKSYCTYPELLLAINQGVIIDEDNIQVDIFAELDIGFLAFSWFLEKLVKERAKYPKGSIQNLILKLMANSFYGKLAQGVKQRKVFTLSGKKEDLEHSKITNPHYAAMTTGIVRAAMIAMINEINSFPGCAVINATTDGCMISIPKGKYQINNEVKPTFKELLPELYKRLENLYAIQLLETGRKNMGLEPHTWLEIKAIGDEVNTWRTRANYLNKNGNTLAIARGNIPRTIVKDSKDMQLVINTGENSIDEANLTNIQDMIKYGWDLVRKPSRKRKIHFDYDYKRVLNENNSTNKAPKSIKEWEEYRNVLNSLHKAGKTANYELMELKKGNTNIRVQGSTTLTIVRIFTSAYLQLKGWRDYNLKDYEIANRLEKWRKTYYPDTKWEIIPHNIWDWKARNLYLNVLPNTTRVKLDIVNLAKFLNFELNDEKMKMLMKFI